MSKSLLIVICDFLLLSLLSIANFDKPAQNKVQQKESSTALKEETFAQTQMLETLKVALEAEQQQRLSLSENVELLSKTAEANKLQAQNREKIIRERESQLQEIQRAKKELELEREEILKRSKNLEAKVADANIKNETLQKEIISTSRKLEQSAQERISLEQKLGQMREDDASIKTQLQSTQEQLRQNKERLTQLQAESDKLKLENRAIEAEKRALSTQLEVAATKTKIYEENLKQAQALISVEKVEKEKIISHANTLSQNVSTLATTQKKLSENIVELRPQTPSEIFAKISNKFVDVVFRFSEGGLLGKENATKKLSVLPIEINGVAWLLFDSAQTPLRMTKDAEAPEKLEIVVLSPDKKVWNANKVYSLRSSPNTLAIQLPRDFLSKATAIKMVNEKNIYKFAECVVVNPNTRYYGQAPFMANFTRKEFAKLDVGLIESIFKKFSPATGDVALTRSGEALGVLSSSTDLLLTRDILPLKSLQLGINYKKIFGTQFIRK